MSLLSATRGACRRAAGANPKVCAALAASRCGAPRRSAAATCNKALATPGTKPGRARTCASNLERTCPRFGMVCAMRGSCGKAVYRVQARLIAAAAAAAAAATAAHRQPLICPGARPPCLPRRAMSTNPETATDVHARPSFPMMRPEASVPPEEVSGGRAASGAGAHLRSTRRRGPASRAAARCALSLCAPCAALAAVCRPAQALPRGQGQAVG